MAETMTAIGAGAQPAERRSIRDWPGWDYLPGIAFFVIGVLALTEPHLASFAAGIYLGATLCVAGGFMLVGGIAGVGHRGDWLGILLGLISPAAGVMVLFNPIAGAISLVWVMGAWFIVGGIFELAMGFSVPVGRGWLILIAIVNLVLGGFVIMMPPAQAFAFLGYLVGISLVFRGLWSLAFTADIHGIRQQAESAMR